MSAELFEILASGDKELDTYFEVHKDGELLECQLETNFMVRHHNRGSLLLETLVTYKTTYSGGDKVRYDYWTNQDAPAVKAVIDNQANRWFTHQELIDVFKGMVKDHGVTIQEVD